MINLHSILEHMLLYQHESENYPLTWYQCSKICGSLCKLVACTITRFFFFRYVAYIAFFFSSPPFYPPMPKIPASTVELQNIQPTFVSMAQNPQIVPLVHRMKQMQ